MHFLMLIFRSQHGRVDFEERVLHVHGEHILQSFSYSHFTYKQCDGQLVYVHDLEEGLAAGQWLVRDKHHLGLRHDHRVQNKMLELDQQ